MINNYPTNPGETSSDKPDFKSIVDREVANGVYAGIMKFIFKNNVNCQPTKECEKPLEVFVSRLLAEYVNAEYPFSDSFREHVNKWIAIEEPALKVLWESGAMSPLHGLCHMIGGAAAIDFLEAHREPVLKEIRRIKGEIK